MRGLSQELVDEIIDFLYLHAKETHWSHGNHYHYLSNCALVCRSFVARSQMHLFSQITLPAQPGSRKLRAGDYSRISSLLAILDKNPSLANHIQQLRLVLPAGHTSWMYYTPEMLPLMNKINSTPVPLRTLCIDTATRFQIPSAASFRKVIDFWERTIAPYITTIRIERVTELPPNLLTMCPHLRDLTLLYTIFRQLPEYYAPRSSPPKIEHFDYNLVESPLEGLDSLSLFNFSSLRSLKTDMGNSESDVDKENLEMVEKIIISARCSLESLVVNISPHALDRIESALSTPFNFEGLTALRGFTQIAIFKTPGTDGLSDTCLTLKTIDIAPIHRIHLIVCVNPDAEGLLHNADWQMFVGEVLRIAALGNPRGLILFFDMRYYAPSRFGEKPWTAPDTGPKDYAEDVLDGLLEGPLSSLTNSSAVSLQRQVTVIHPREQYTGDPWEQ